MIINIDRKKKANDSHKQAQINITITTTGSSTCYSYTVYPNNVCTTTGNGCTTTGNGSYMTYKWNKS